MTEYMSSSQLRKQRCTTSSLDSRSPPTIQRSTQAMGLWNKHLHTSPDLVNVPTRYLKESEAAETEREEANRLAIGGLRDSHGSVKRLPQTALFGLSLGKVRIVIVETDEKRHQEQGTPERSWIAETCNLIGNPGRICNRKWRR